jgi:hypothetical protein
MLGKIMVGAAAFTPTDDSWDYSSSGIELYQDSGYGRFMAPLSFPVPVVNLRKITLIAYDNSGTGEVCAKLFRAHPLSANSYNSGGLCTADSSDSPQRVARTALSYRKVYTVTQAPYLWVEIDAPGLVFYGVQIVYSY